MKDYIPVIVVFILLLIGGIFFITKNNDSTSQSKSAERSSTQAQNVIDDSVKLIVGNKSAPATIVEYFDYKCPSCNNFHQTTGKEIEKAYVETNQVNYEIVVTPIIGPDSGNAGRGAYCAQEQGKFNDYHTAVIDFMWDSHYSTGDLSSEFENILTTSKLIEVVKNLELNEESFRACVNSEKYNSNLDNNLLRAADDSIRGTPGFAIGEQSFVGGQPFSVFKTLIDIELR